MKKQNLLTLLFTTTISMTLICTQIDVQASAINLERYNTDLIASAQITIEPAIVLKGKSITCGNDLDRNMALEYLNKDKTSVSFNNIIVMINLNNESEELIEGVKLDLNEYDGQQVSLDYVYKGKILKTLKLNIECTGGSIEFTEEANSGEITVEMISMDSTETLDIFKYINVEAVGGRENIDIKIFDDIYMKQADKIPLNNAGAFTVTYSLKNDPTVSKELKVYVKEKID